jgi:type IV pilus assembly protein PilB
LSTSIFQYKRLGEILIENQYLTEKEIELAVSLQKQEKKPLGQILVEKGFVTWNDIATALSKQYSLPFLESVAEIEPDPDALSILSKHNIENWRAIPFSKDEDRNLKVLIDQTNSLPSIKRDIQFITGYTPSFYIVSKPNLDYLLKELFGSAIDSVEDLKSSIEVTSGKPQAVMELEPSAQMGDIDKESTADSAPVIKFVNEMVMGAVTQEASDIHIEPQEKNVRVRFRIDGLLRKIAEYPVKLHSSIVSRIKIISKLDIAERRLPQDGKFFVRVKGEQYDLRVSTMPSIFGEKIVLRLLRVSNSTKRLDDLGLSDYNYKRLSALLESPYGILLVTGPTGSGKSTTLAGVLNQLKAVTNNMITVEDPVEYSITGTTQCQVQPEIGLTFARYLRAILRQDPDIIMVGEIRDKETAILAMEASMTGHLVLSTLHTNTASAAIYRLVNMGIEADVLGVSLIGIVAQRLVRTLCDSCKKKAPLASEEMEKVATQLLPGHSEYSVCVPEGCQRCRKTGYRGRTAIHEVLIMDKRIRALMLENTPERIIEENARKAGMRTMFEDGIYKALMGITSIDEVKRVAVE